MSKQNILTTEQIASFKAHGYLILENLIEMPVIENWRDQLWTPLGSSLESPDTWPTDQVALNDFRFSPPESAFGQQPTMQKIVEQLGGENFTGGGGSPIINWPRPTSEWSMPTHGHIDGYGPAGWTPFMLGATTYLYDVEPGGGAFVYWPGSHRTTHEYFRQYPEQIDGSYKDIEGVGWQVFSNRAPEAPREFIAPAGTVVLWHAFLCHTGSTNVRLTPRFGLFARWRHKRRDEIKYDIPENLWKYWST